MTIEDDLRAAREASPGFCVNRYTWDEHQRRLPRMEWSTFIARTQAREAKRERAFRTFIARTIKLAALADPATGGNSTLVNNWGNEHAKRIWRDAWPRWRRYADRMDALYHADWEATRTPR